MSCVLFVSSCGFFSICLSFSPTFSLSRLRRPLSLPVLLWETRTFLEFPMFGRFVRRHEHRMPHPFSFSVIPVASSLTRSVYYTSYDRRRRSWNLQGQNGSLNLHSQMRARQFCCYLSNRREHPKARNGRLPLPSRPWRVQASHSQFSIHTCLLVQYRCKCYWFG